MAFNNVDFGSRIAALRAAGLALGVPNSSLPSINATADDISCLRWINKIREAQSVPRLSNLDYTGFMKAFNDLGTLTSAASTWSASDATANGMTLSNGGLTVTPQSATGWHTLRSNISRSSGKLYAEFAADATAAYEYQLFGLASPSINLATNLGGSNYSAGAWPSNINYVSSGFTSNAVPGSVSVGPNIVIGIAVDFAAGKVWLSHNNIWYNASDPVAGLGPILSFVPATVGALFLGMSFDGVAGATNGVWTLQPTAASQKYAPPSGFSAWG